MNLGGFLCPWCGYYNPKSASDCARCKRHLPPASLAGWVRRLSTTELWATKLLAGVSILVFALEMAAGGHGLASMGLLRGVSVSVLLRFGALSNGLDWNEPWRFLSACFVHMGILHVGMNMLALADLGRVGEPQVKGERFLITYVITGIIGFMISTWWYQGQPYLTAGASGAIFGVAGLIIGDLVAKRDPRWKDMLIRMVLYSFVFYFLLHTNQAAHLGGLGAGLLLGLLFARETRPWRLGYLITPLSLVCLLAILISLILPQRSSVWRTARALEEDQQVSPPPASETSTEVPPGEQLLKRRR